MRARRRLLVLAILSCIPALGVSSGASGHVPGVMLYSFGSASVDGTLAAGEWDNAARRSFQATTPPFDGGGTIAVELLEMNDGVNLYLAVRIGRPLASSSVSFDFDNAHDGVFGPGDDSLVAHANQFHAPEAFDRYYMSSVAVVGLDRDDGGTEDVALAASGAGGVTTFEISHPLDSADDRHDFNLTPGARIGFQLQVRLFSLTPTCNFGPTCYADTSFPGQGNLGFGDLVVAPDAVAPETTIVAGPRPGARTRNRAVVFAFSGRDNLSPAEKLTFACSLDGAAFAPCVSRIRYRNLRIGRHRFAVRATDELGNADATPALRAWRVVRRPKR